MTAIKPALAIAFAALAASLLAWIGSAGD